LQTSGTFWTRVLLRAKDLAIRQFPGKNDDLTSTFFLFSIESNDLHLQNFVAQEKYLVVRVAIVRSNLHYTGTCTASVFTLFILFIYFNNNSTRAWLRYEYSSNFIFTYLT